MRRIVLLLAALVLLVTGAAVPANAAPPSPLVGPWLGQDTGTNQWGTPDNSNLFAWITRGARYLITDDGASFCEDAVDEFVPLTLAGRGTFSPDGLTFTTEAVTDGICWTSSGPRRVVLTGPVVLVFDPATRRIETYQGDVCTDWWRPWQPQPAACMPS